MHPQQLSLLLHPHPAAFSAARCGTGMSGSLEAPPQRSDWIVAICSVLFDLDVGQRIDSIVPEGALTEEEANDVAFHSFPVRRQIASAGCRRTESHRL